MKLSYAKSDNIIMWVVMVGGQWRLNARSPDVAKCISGQRDRTMNRSMKIFVTFGVVAMLVVLVSAVPAKGAVLWSEDFESYAAAGESIVGTSPSAYTI